MSARGEVDQGQPRVDSLLLEALVPRRRRLALQRALLSKIIAQANAAGDRLRWLARQSGDTEQERATIVREAARLRLALSWSRAELSTAFSMLPRPASNAPEDHFGAVFVALCLGATTTTEAEASAEAAAVAEAARSLFLEVQRHG